MRVVCIGSGYVGTVTAAAFAAIGHQTTVIDVDRTKVNLLNSGKSPIYEPGLEPLLQRLPKAALHASTSYQAVHSAETVLICVGTPQLKSGLADLSHVEMAARQLAEQLDPARFTAVAVKSTVPVGTARLVASIIEEVSGLRADEHFAVVSNPEFLREGCALEDVFFPDRIIIGASHAEARQRMNELYRGIVGRDRFPALLNDFPFMSKLASPQPVYVETDSSSAEMIKYASNAFLAVKISYINELARLCEAIGGNVLEVGRGMGLDPRIGERFLQASAGWGGSCLPKDTAQLLAVSRQYGCELSIVKAAINANRGMMLHCIEKLRRRLKTLNGKRIGILGLTFKPDTDDVRDTQAAAMIPKLLELKAGISVHDPMGMDMFRRLNGGLGHKVTYCNSAERVADKADAIVLLTHWNSYRQLDWELMAKRMRNPYVLDTRNFLNETGLRALGFDYEGLGTP